MPYPNKTVVEMHPQQSCRHGGIGRDMVPGGFADKILSRWTCFTIEIFSKLASVTKP